AHQVRAGHRILRPSFGEAFEAALLANRILTFLMATAALRHYVAIALAHSESLEDQRSVAADEKLMAQFCERADDVERQLMTEFRQGTRSLKGQIGDLGVCH